MKKLIQKSTMVLLILSLFVVSCEKEKPKPASIPLSSEITYKNEKGEDVTVKGNVEDGPLGIYSISVFKHGPVEQVNCKGTWSYDVKPKPFFKLQDKETGLVQIRIKEPGTYVVTITFTPCTGPPSTIKVTITVK